MKIDAMLAETELTVKQLLNLQESDIISFSKNATSASTKIYINNKEKWQAIAGASNNIKAIQTQSNIDHEKMETLASLKGLNDQRREETRKANEAIAKLLESRNQL